MFLLSIIYLLQFLLSFHELYLQVAPLLVGLLLLLLSLENLLPLSLFQNLLELGFVLRSQAPVQNQSVKQHVELNRQPPRQPMIMTLQSPHSEGD